ncbi:hypothetical protein ABES33_26275, partial [Bacillus pseudomycoides]
ETLFRKYAYEQGANLNAYMALEIEIRELLKTRGHKDRFIPSDVRELFIEKIDRLPKEKLRVIEVPDEFNLITFMRAFEQLVRTGIQVTTAEQVLEVIETN